MEKKKRERERSSSSPPSDEIWTEVLVFFFAGEKEKILWKGGGIRTNFTVDKVVSAEFLFLTHTQFFSPLPTLFFFRERTRRPPSNFISDILLHTFSFFFPGRRGGAFSSREEMSDPPGRPRPRPQPGAGQSRPQLLVRLALLTLALSAAPASTNCRLSEFQCRRSASCVRMDRFCDGRDDCGDRSDEPEGCTSECPTNAGVAGGRGGGTHTLGGDTS